MQRLPTLDDIKGTELWLKKDRSKTYVVDGVNFVKRKVHLSPTHEGGGKLWKNFANLWRDYERARAMAAGSRVGQQPEPKPIVEPKLKMRDDDDDEVMSEQERARWLGEDG